MMPSWSPRGKKFREASTAARHSCQDKSSMKTMLNAKGLPEAVKKKLKGRQLTEVQRQKLNQFYHANKKEAEEGEEETPSHQETIVQLQKDIETLSKKCACLESQNILVSAQQLDILAISTSLALSLLTAYLYCKLLWWAVPQFPIVLETRLPQILQQFPIAERMTTPLSLSILKYALVPLPYVHHKMTYGLAHRRFEVFVTAFIVIFRFKLCKWRGSIFKTDPTTDVLGYGQDTNEDAIWEASNEVSARFLYLRILRLRGLWTKSAQYVSSRADFMPLSFTRELKKLQDEAPATEWKDVQRELTKSGVLKYLKDVEQTPIASASIGQVHTARLTKTGEKVVVKVQHPCARFLLLDDFWSMKIIFRVVSWMEPEYAFFEIIVREWAVEAKKELDFLYEASNLESAEASIKNITQDKNGVLYTNPTPSCAQAVPFQVEIPRPLKELCTRNVLVMGFCEGSRVDDLKQIEQWKLPKEAVMDAVSQAFAHMMYVSDIFNGDPHPGNISIRPGTTVSSKEGFTVVLLDWGLVKRMSENKRVAFCQIVYAAATLDFGLLLDGYEKVGLKMKRENVAEDLEGMRFLLRDMVPRDKHRKRIQAKIKTDQSRFEGKKRGERVSMESKAFPGEFFFFVRVTELLHGLGSSLDVDLSYLDVLKPYAARGLENSTLYQKSKGLLNEPTVLQIGNNTLNDAVKNIVDICKQEGAISGAQVCVLDSKGKTLANISSGHMGGLKRKIPMSPDALILGYSCTKAVTATLAHLMVEKGYLSYDEPISKRVWKAFCPSERPPQELQDALAESISNLDERWEWKRSITLRHILTHGAGLWMALPPAMTIKSLANCETCCSAFEYNPDKADETILPSSKPGEKTEYHFISFGWLVAGTLCGAYVTRHEKPSTFEHVYNAILCPKLSPKTLQSGFSPFGGDGEHPRALVDTSDNMLVKMFQLQREAEGMSDETHNPLKALEDDTSREIQKAVRGREFILDSRIWNCGIARNANVPAAGGRFSAMALASFYHELGTGQVLSNETLASVTQEVVTEEAASRLVSRTVMTPEGDHNKKGVTFGMGYQIMSIDSVKTQGHTAFGHSGIGGSIGFHYKEVGTSVAIMLNKADGDAETAARIVRVIAKHLKW